MKVVSYLSTVPSKNTNQEKTQVLLKFAQGVAAAGDTGVIHHSNSIIPADVAMIQGWQHQHGKHNSHLQLRKAVIDTQTQGGRHVCVADANLFLYATSGNTPHHYLRYSFDGVFPSTGVYFDNRVDRRRWQQISKDLDIPIQDVKLRGDKILLCLQRQGGWSMGNQQVINWAINAVASIRQHTSRTIVIRSHPKDSRAKITYLPQLRTLWKLRNDIEFSDCSLPIEAVLSDTWAVVNHNSSAIVGPIINGYPAFITDPINSQCAQVSHHDFSKIENPQEFDRQRWLERISMFHWSFSELSNGAAWQHMRNYVRQ